MRFDNVQDMLPVRLVSPLSIEATTPIVSQSLDTKGFMAVSLMFATGTLTDLVATVLIEDSPDDVVYTAVADSFLIGNLEANLALAITNDDEVASIGYRGDERFVRVTVTPTTATVTGNTFSLIGLLSQPEKGPTVPPKFI